MENPYFMIKRTPLRSVRIIHFSTADNEGGSARSAYRIHQGLRQRGHTSHMLVRTKVTNDPDVSTVSGSTFGAFLDRLAEKITSRLGYQYWYVPSSRRVLRHPWVKKAQIIQLYNTHGGYFSHRILPVLSRMAPIVWRLSDMWPMTPHAAYAYGCECYQKGPDHCRCDLNWYPAIGRNTKKALWQMKERMYAKSQITIVAPSSWTEKLARESLLLSRFPVHRIPNGVDLSIWYPREKLSARALLQLDPHKKIILFSAHGLDNNPRKGSEFVLEALQRLKGEKNTLVVLAGHGGSAWAKKSPLPVKNLGYLADPKTMAMVYSAADFIVLPSVVENLPNTLLEAMACGTPAVAFDAGGMKDAVRHEQTGYLARYQDLSDFIHGIQLLLQDETLRHQLGRAARILVEKEFDQKKEAERFENLYRSLLG